MTKFIAVAGVGNVYTRATEHHVEKVITGDSESVRERLIYALGKLDYRLLSEQPLVAKRGTQTSSCSFNALKCVKSLTISLRQLNPTSTLATFNYEIVNSVVTNGDRQTMEREAEALIALADARSAATVCASCGTNNSGDSRFCRACGAPNVLSEPAELEVLRLTAGARPAHQLISLGVLSALLFAVVGMLLIFFNSKGPKAGLILLSAGEIFAAYCLLYGMWHLHRTLNPKREAQGNLPLNVPHTLPSAQTVALPPHSTPASVTEGTTELLTPERERVAVPVSREKVDTAEMKG